MLVQVLADTAVLATLLLAAGLLVLLATRGLSSGARESIATIVLYLACLAPFWAVAYDLGPARTRTGTRQPPAPQTALGPAVQTLETPANAPGPLASAPGKPEPGSGSEAALPEAAPAAWLSREIVPGLGAATLAAALWGAGTLVALARLCVTLRRARALRRALPTSADARVRRIAEPVARGLGLPLPDLRDDARAASPFSLGGGRGGVVVVPSALAARLDDRELEAVLVHETAHVSHRHHGLAIQQRLVLAAYWWNPLAHLVSRALDSIKEEVCDDHVLARQRDPEAYARCLVRIADMALTARPAVAAIVLPLDFGFAKRVRRLLAHRGRIDMNPHSRHRRLLCGLSLLPVVLAAPGMPGLAPRFPAQEPRAQEAAQKKAPSCSDYFPYREGATWEYELGDPKGDQRSKQTWTTVGEVQAGDHRCWEMRIKGHYDAWEYVGARTDGWYRYHNAYLGGMRGVNARQAPELLLMCPLGVSLGWNWEEQMSVQVSAGPGDAQVERLSAEDLKTKHKVTIDAMDEVVRVKAGEFKAIKLRDEMSGKYYGEGTTIRWYAPGVGLVRELQSHKRWESEFVRELVRFTPGGTPKPPVDHEALLKKKIETLRQQTVGGLERTITWYDQDCFKTWFKARFARVNGVAWPFRVTAEGAELFDPASPSAWDAASRAEKHEFKDDIRDGGLLEALARCCALLVGGSKGADPTIARLPDGSVSVVEHGKDQSRGSVAVRAGDWSGIVRVTVKDGEINRIDVEPLVKKQ